MINLSKGNEFIDACIDNNLLLAKSIFSSSIINDDSMTEALENSYESISIMMWLLSIYKYDPCTKYNLFINALENGSKFYKYIFKICMFDNSTLEDIIISYQDNEKISLKLFYLKYNL